MSERAWFKWVLVAVYLFGAFSLPCLPSSETATQAQHSSPKEKEGDASAHDNANRRILAPRNASDQHEAKPQKCKECSGGLVCSAIWPRIFHLADVSTYDPVAFFTLMLAISTIGLWWVTLQTLRHAQADAARQSSEMRDSIAAAVRNAVAAEQSASEARSIGQAQVRAYVSLVNVGVAFASWVPDDVVAQVQVTPKNDGQSPARGFVWRPTLRFYGKDKRRSRGSSLWVSQGGVTVPANSPGRPDSLLMGDMRAFQFAQGQENITINLRVEFQYIDVFDNLIREETYFVGHTSLVRDQNGRPIWAGAALTSMPPMESWDAPFHGTDE